MKESNWETNLYLLVAKKLLKEHWPFVLFILASALMIAVHLHITASIAEASCSRDAGELNPETRRLYHELKDRAKAVGIDFKVICTYRTQGEQDRLYAQGRIIPGKKITWTRKSKHTDRNAFDIVRVKDNRISWELEDYHKLGELGKELGLTWGGDWKARDYGHFQLD